MRWLLFFLFPFCVQGFYVGNPGSPGIMNAGFFTNRNPFIKITSGYIADYTSNKRYVANQNQPNFDPNDTFKEFGLHSQLASLSVILLERLEIFGTLGGTKERAKWHGQPMSDNPLTIYFDFKSSHSFSWSAGARVILIQWGQTFLSTDFSFFEVPETSKSYFQFFQKIAGAPMEKQYFNMNEWQINGGLASRFWFLIPYVGVNYLRSRMHIQHGPATEAVNYHNKEHIGYFFGLSLSLGPKLFVNFERRIRNEFAYSFATTAVF
ncbi:MAG: hypothetical protein JSS32_00875 [Verrucomicrobia bacterium]|nr:hypothetical protein [Verrucomicrobiota bacterium]